MIQDISPKQLLNAYKAGMKPEANDTVFVFKGRDVLVNSNNHKGQSDDQLFPTWEELGKPENCIFVFEISGQNFYLLNLYGEDKVTIPEEYAFENVRDIREAKTAPQEIFYGYYTALHLSKWYRTSQYCGACGSHMHHDSKERAMKCDACGNMVFPRINPAVIVGVIDGDKILCTKYSPKHMPGVTYYALIAGFTEIGETFEETVKREVMEEVGVKVKNIRFYKSQPWGSSGDILCGFYCDLDGSNELHVDHEELSKAVWSKPEDVILQPDDWSLTNEMMKNFKDGNIC